MAIIEAAVIAAAQQISGGSNSLIGDDCACLPYSETHDLLVTTDALYEGVHFLSDAMTPAQLAHKALAVNLSDLAAMGLSDTQNIKAFLTLCLPNDITEAWLAAFWQGWQQLSDQYQMELAGGDTTRAAGPLVINITLLTPCLKTNIKRRADAKNGDIIAVTGYLGDSLTGLRQLLDPSQTDPKFQILVDRHHLPPNRLSEAAWLGTQAAVHGMMDLSDGLARDLPKLCRAAQCGGRLALEHLPLSTELQAYAQQYQLSAIDLAYSGGEDYELLLTVASDSWPYLQQQFKQAFPQTPLTAIGQMTSDPAIILTQYDIRYEPVVDYGFDHFA